MWKPDVNLVPYRSHNWLLLIYTKSTRFKGDTTTINIHNRYVSLTLIYADHNICSLCIGTLMYRNFFVYYHMSFCNSLTLPCSYPFCVPMCVFLYNGETYFTLLLQLTFGFDYWTLPTRLLPMREISPVVSLKICLLRWKHTIRSWYSDM